MKGSKAMSSADKGGQHAEPFTVKNTFIEIDNEFFEESDGMDGIMNVTAKRQVSEPAFVFGRQCSSRPPLVPLQEEPEKQQEENEALESDIDEPETETEPGARQVTYQQWAESRYTHDGMLSADAAPWPGAWPAVDQMASGLELGEATMVDQVVHLFGGSASIQPCETVPAEWGETTTVMMRNLPNRYTQQMLLEEVTESGFSSLFDFFYLPIDPETQANKGYAFINFVDPLSSWRFKVMFEGKQMSRFNSSKYVSVSAAALQGLTANYAHYSTARCSRGDPAARPLFLREPQQGLSSRGRGAAGTRRGGARRRNSGRSLVDVAAAKQNEAGRAEPAVEKVAEQPAKESKGDDDAAGRVARFCPYCGGATQPSYKFCQFCGASQAVVVDNLMGA